MLTFKGWFPLRSEIKQRMDSAKRVIYEIIAMPLRSYKKHEKGYYMNLLSSSTTMYGSIYSAINIRILSAAGCCFNLFC